MSTKYLAAVCTYDHGIAYVPNTGAVFSSRSFAKKFTDKAEAFEAALRLKKKLEKEGFTGIYVFEPMEYKGIESETIAPSDAVQSPTHYQLGGIEAIDVIDEAVDDPASFYRGNAIKYLLRAGRKGDTREDLRKARYYIDRELSNE